MPPSVSKPKSKATLLDIEKLILSQPCLHSAADRGLPFVEANYLERGDFTIDVMMYDLPKDVQEAHPNKSGKRQVCSLLRKVDGTLHKFQLPPAQSLAYSSINLVFAIPAACPAGLALGAPRTPANPTTTHIAFLVPTTGTPPPLLNL